MRKKILVFLALLFVISNTLINTSYASELISSPDADNSIQYIPCPVGPGRCKMYQHGIGVLYKINSDGSTTRLFTGSCYQCSQCNVTIVSEVHPSWGYLGTYGIDFNFPPISGAGAILETVNILYNSSIADDSYLSSMTWYY